MRTITVVAIMVLAVACLACSDPLIPDPVRFYSDVATGGDHSCAIAEDGSAWCWGRGADGELGYGGRDNQIRPTAVAGGLKFKQITAGDAHTCALTIDDRVYCWGWNAFYNLGNPAQQNPLEPVRIQSDLAFRGVSAGAHHACAVAQDNRVFCWGHGAWGQNGNGTTNTGIFPIPLSGDLRFTAVSAGAFHTCALTAAGILYCWGRNDRGQLGIGSSVAFVTTPTAVSTQLRFRSVDAGAAHTCAIATTGRPFCWGSNEYGELGDGAPFGWGLAGPAVPTGVLFLDNVTEISAGTDHTCAIDSGGMTHCWGRGVYGQLGNGTTSDQAVRQPVLVSPTRRNERDLHTFTRLAAGGRVHVCGLAEGRVFCWGTGDAGQLGNERSRYAVIPQRVRD